MPGLSGEVVASTRLLVVIHSPASLFTSASELLVVREDVGRHNAMDKVIGHALIGGATATLLWEVMRHILAWY